MNTLTITTEIEYKNALIELDRLLDLGTAIGSIEEQRLEMLAMLMHNYERSLEPLPNIINEENI